MQARCLHLHNTTESHGATEASNLFIFQSQSVKLTYAHTQKKGLNGFSKPPKQNKIYAHPLFPRLIKKIKKSSSSLCLYF